jgi:hypothetical protein
MNKKIVWGVIVLGLFVFGVFASYNLLKETVQTEILHNENMGLVKLDINNYNPFSKIIANIKQVVFFDDNPVNSGEEVEVQDIETLIYDNSNGRQYITHVRFKIYLDGEPMITELVQLDYPRENFETIGTSIQYTPILPGTYTTETEYYYSECFSINHPSYVTNADCGSPKGIKLRKYGEELTVEEVVEIDRGDCYSDAGIVRAGERSKLEVTTTEIPGGQHNYLENYYLNDYCEWEERRKYWLTTCNDGYVIEWGSTQQRANGKHECIKMPTQSNLMVNINPSNARFSVIRKFDGMVGDFSSDFIGRNRRYAFYEYTVKAYLDGYVTEYADVSIVAWEDTVVNFELKKIGEIIPDEDEIIVDVEISDPDWFSGFVEGEEESTKEPTTIDSAEEPIRSDNEVFVIDVGEDNSGGGGGSSGVVVEEVEPANIQPIINKIITTEETNYTTIILIIVLVIIGLVALYIILPNKLKGLLK